MQTRIIFEDEQLFVVHKPPGLPVHKNEHMPKDADYLLKEVNKLTGRELYNVHRLDQPTSGLVILAANQETARHFAREFSEKRVEKTYLSLVHGPLEEEGRFDFRVHDKSKKRKTDALTNYRCIGQGNIPIAFRDDAEVYVSLAEVQPQTGRWHQIRQHFGGTGHYIIGDNQHGSRQLNKILKEFLNIEKLQLLLHASSISFHHPTTNELMSFTDDLPEYFREMLKLAKIDI